MIDTLEFITIEILEETLRKDTLGIKYIYRYNLEFFFYVFLLICICYS